MEMEPATESRTGTFCYLQLCAFYFVLSYLVHHAFLLITRKSFFKPPTAGWRPLEKDRRKRNERLKRRFHPKLVPKQLDAIVIGSGMGGLTCAALMSRAGKKVLVLEQHDILGWFVFMRSYDFN